MALNSTRKSLQGWTSSPNSRGTFDILWPCLATIFLSTWSALCLNVPEPFDTKWTHFKRKIWTTFISAMGPEFLVGTALGEWESAHFSVARFKELRQDNKWTLKHAFFADMGGYMLQTSDDVKFFLNAKHIIWLLEHGAISTAQFEERILLDSKTIDDRNKSDIFTRVFAVSQALWFCVNIIARGAQGLAVTTLEVTTVGIIVDKEDAHARTRPHSRTPLEFASREVWSFSLSYHYLMNILKAIRPQLWQRKMEKSFGRRSDTDVLPVTGAAFVTGWLSTAAFISTYFIAWNFHFPTPIERLLWRLTSGMLVAMLLVGPFYFNMLYGERGIKRMQEKVRKYRKALEDAGPPGEKSKWKDRLVYKLRSFAMKIMNNSPGNDPSLDVSLFFVFVAVPSLATYALLRAYVWVEDLIACRALPADAYKTVNWSAFIPHFG
ncbi:hypothetical protein EV356DRAFT_535048 [Viridothelium virens]|uniref:Uncharacterized protein n=1 Tax=Viridothelium virens TaxID=1048519 RepID=A0A6A6H1C5_VIRVR|nr:hypothetical protein EV356DRAFT_535048 [Viridothelium virens]